MTHAHRPCAVPPGAASMLNERRLALAFALTGTFMLVEAAGGVLSGSLALLADAGHMLTDSAALALAWWAARLGRRRADARRTYGYHRAEIIAAFLNGITLLLIAAWIVYEAVRRLAAPPEIAGPLMLGVAAAGLVVNAVVLRVLHTGAGTTNLNVRAAALHVVGDLAGSGAAVIAGAVIIAIGWTPIDPILSLLIAGLILRSGWIVARQAAHVLMEGTPTGIEPEAVHAHLLATVPHLRDVHHVHVWSLTPERPLVTLHAVIDEGTDAGPVLAAIKRALAERFGVDHTTVQIERGACADTAAPDAPAEGSAR